MPRAVEPITAGRPGWLSYFTAAPRTGKISRSLSLRPRPAATFRVGFQWGIEFRLRLPEPEPHVHIAVELHSGRQMLSPFGVVATAAVELAKAKVAVGGERPHAEFVAPGEGLSVIPLSCRRIGGSACAAISPRRRRTHASLPRSF